ncbi:MAG: VOC family protein [Acidimicrobiales bacterium]
MDVGFDHVTLAVSDLDGAKRFFALLGFDEDKEVVVSGPEMSAYMGIEGWEAEHVTLVLTGAPVRQEVQLLRFHSPPIRLDAASGDLTRTGFSHVCFRVSDLDATVARVRSGGVRTRNEIMDFHDRRLVFLEGPDGVVVELAEWRRP